MVVSEDTDSIGTACGLWSKGSRQMLAIRAGRPLELFEAEVC
jgi:hypothetical protein